MFVDEAQDTNTIQFDIIRKLSWEYGNITLIWDDFQSLYGWRGAVIEEFLNAKEYWPDMSIFKLETNYRSKKTIVDAWSHIISHNDKQYKKDIVAKNTNEQLINIVRFWDDRIEAEQVVIRIKEMKEQYNKEWKDFAVIYRTNIQSKAFWRFLIAENIPYKIWWAYKFFEREEIKDILAYVKYISGIDSAVSLDRIINVPARKIWKTSIAKLKECAQASNVSFKQILQQIDSVPVWPSVKSNIKEFNWVIRILEEKLENCSPSQFIKSIIKEIGYEDYLDSDFDNKEVVTKLDNIWQLIDSASNYEDKWSVWISQFVEDIALIVDMEDNKAQANAVQLMTVHASKWLEFDTVFIVWCEENVFPSFRVKDDDELLEEERRWMYVAVTRAKEEVFITHADRRMQYWRTNNNKPSRFIGEIPRSIRKHITID